MAVSNILHTERLRLEPFGEKYISDFYVRWLNDPTVTRYSEQRHKTHSVQSCRSYLESFDGSSSFFWAIVVNDKSLGHIGNLAVEVDAPNLVANLTIMIGKKEAWGNGYGTEAWKRVCAYLLEDAGMRKLTAGVMAINGPMLAIMRKCGMEDDGCLKRQFICDGRAVDCIYMAIFAD